MAASPRTDFNFLDLPAPDVSDVKIAELLRLQKFAQRITASLDLDEIASALRMTLPPRSAASKSTSTSTTPAIRN